MSANMASRNIGAVVGICVQALPERMSNDLNRSLRKVAIGMHFFAGINTGDRKPAFTHWVNEMSEMSSPAATFVCRFNHYSDDGCSYGILCASVKSMISQEEEFPGLILFFSCSARQYIECPKQRCESHS